MCAPIFPFFLIVEVVLDVADWFYSCGASFALIYRWKTRDWTYS